MSKSLLSSIKKNLEAQVVDLAELEKTKWISTGSTVLDIMISNRRHPQAGLPLGRIVELFGLEGSGKSLMAAHIIASCQRQGGIGILIDTENAVDPRFLQAIGIDVEDNFMLINEYRLEKIFAIIEKIILKLREKDTEVPVVIVIDSIAGATTENEINADYEKQGFNTDKAIVLSMAMRKITNLIGNMNILLVVTNQVRYNVGVMYGDPFTTSGGKAIAFHSSVRINMRQTKKIKQGTTVVGAEIRPHIVKNRLGPPERSCSFDLYFTTGIDDLGSWFRTLKEEGAINHKSAGWYYLQNVDKSTGEVKYLSKKNGAWSWSDSEDDRFLFRESVFSQTLKDDDEFRSMVYDALANTLIQEYDYDWIDKSAIQYIPVPQPDYEEAEKSEKKTRGRKKKESVQEDVEHI